MLPTRDVRRRLCEQLAAIREEMKGPGLEERRSTLNEAIAALMPDDVDQHGVLAMRVRTEGGKVRLEWDRPLEFLAFAPNQAHRLADALANNARLVEGTANGQADTAPEHGSSRLERFRAIAGGKGGDEAQPEEHHRVRPAGDSASAEAARGELERDQHADHRRDSRAPGPGAPDGLSREGNGPVEG